MENQITFRKFAEPDLDALLEIAVAAWEPIYDYYRESLGTDMFLAFYPDWQESKKEQIRQSCNGKGGAEVYVLEAEGEPAGFITFTINRERKTGVIGNNAVHPKWRGRGFGTRMYNEVLAMMENAGVRYVNVTTGDDPSHAPARRAYEKAGFEKKMPSVQYFKVLGGE